MNTTLTTQNPRGDLLRRLILPVLVFILSAVSLIQLPRENYFSPRPLNSKSRYENFYNRDLPCVTVTVPELSYTGCRYLAGGRVRGYYYYTLVDGLCQFYLLDEKTGDPSVPLRENITLTGRLVRMDEEEYRSLTEYMAEALGWLPGSLREVSSPYAVSLLPRPAAFMLLLRLFSLGCLLLSLADIFMLLRRGA